MTGNVHEPAQPFDAERALWDYRRVMADLEAATTDERKLLLPLISLAWAIATLVLFLNQR